MEGLVFYQPSSLDAVFGAFAAHLTRHSYVFIPHDTHTDIGVSSLCYKYGGQVAASHMSVFLMGYAGPTGYFVRQLCETFGQVTLIHGGSGGVNASRAVLEEMEDGIPGNLTTLLDEANSTCRLAKLHFELTKLSEDVHLMFEYVHHRAANTNMLPGTVNCIAALEDMNQTDGAFFSKLERCSVGELIQTGARVIKRQNEQVSVALKNTYKVLLPIHCLCCDIDAGQRNLMDRLACILSDDNESTHLGAVCMHKEHGVLVYLKSSFPNRATEAAASSSSRVECAIEEIDKNTCLLSMEHEVWNRVKGVK